MIGAPLQSSDDPPTTQSLQIKARAGTDNARNIGLLSRSKKVVCFTFIWNFYQLGHPVLVPIEVHHRRAVGITSCNKHAVGGVWNARHSTHEGPGPMVVVLERPLMQAVAESVDIEFRNPNISLLF